MKNLTFTERVMKATNKNMELTVALCSLEGVEPKAVEQILELTKTIFQDEIELIGMLDESNHEHEDFSGKEIQIPSFMQLKRA